MSALTHLYAHQRANPSWFDYKEDDTVIFEANYLVPLFWLALFSEKHYLAWLDPEGDSEDLEDNRVPCLIASKKECLALLDKRQDYLVSLFSHCSDILKDFRNSIDAVAGKYLSIEMSEVFYMAKDSDAFFQDLHNILKMFDSMDCSALKPLMNITGSEGYDKEKRDYIPAEPAGFMNYRYHAIGLAEQEQLLNNSPSV